MGLLRGPCPCGAENRNHRAIAHPEGFPTAVANIYVDLAAAIRGEPQGAFPKRWMGYDQWKRHTKAVVSALDNRACVNARPPSLRG